MAWSCTVRPCTSWLYTRIGSNTTERVRYSITAVLLAIHAKFSSFHGRYSHEKPGAGKGVRSTSVYALEFFPAHEPKVLFFLSPALTKMVHAPRTTRYLDSLPGHRILRWAIHCWPRRPSNHRRELRLHPGQFRQPATKSRRRGRPRGAHREGASVFVDVEHILETNQETTY